jgi:hypothetical protein
MTISDLITKIPTELLGESDITLLYRDDAVTTLPADYRWVVGDFVFRYGNTDGDVLFEPVPLTNYLPEFTTAEEWLSEQGYRSIRVVTLLDLERQLAAAGKTSAKLAAVRAWLNGVLSTYVTDPTPKSDWTPAPFGFEETSAEAFAELAT